MNKFVEGELFIYDDRSAYKFEAVIIKCIEHDKYDIKITRCIKGGNSIKDGKVIYGLNYKNFKKFPMNRNNANS